MAEGNMRILQTGPDGLPILVEQAKDVSLIMAFNFTHMEIRSDVQNFNFPPVNIQARMFVAIFWTTTQGQHVELLRDSSTCLLQSTSDGNIAIFSDHQLSIPAEKLHVKKRSEGPGVVSYGLPESTNTRIFFETVDYQHAWPLLGSPPISDSFPRFCRGQDVFTINDMNLGTQGTKLLSPGNHILSLEAKTLGSTSGSTSGFKTSLFLLVRTELVTANPLPEGRVATVYESSAKAGKTHDHLSPPKIRSNHLLTPESSRAIAPQKPAAEKIKQPVSSRKRRRDPDDNYEGDASDLEGNLKSSPRASRGKKMDFSSRRQTEEDNEAMEAENSEADNSKRKMRSSRNLKPRYVPRSYFKDLMCGNGEEPSRTSERLRKPSGTTSTDRVKPTIQDAFGGGNISSSDPEEIVLPRIRASKIRASKVALVPESRRPLFTMTNRRMLVPGEELHPSDDEPDEESAIQRNIESINDISDITADEKEFSIKWNLWSFKKGNASTCGTYLQRNLIRFCEENQEWFLERQVRITEMCKFWKVARDRVAEVTINTWVECLKHMEPESRLWKS